MNIPLERYLELVIRHNQYGVISQDEAIAITLEDLKDFHCIVENGELKDFAGTLLPKLENSLYRVWRLKDWNEFQSQERVRKQISREKMEKEKIEKDKKQAVVDKVLSLLMSKGCSESQAKELVVKMGEHTVLELGNNLV